MQFTDQQISKMYWAATIWLGILLFAFFIGWWTSNFYELRAKCLEAGGTTVYSGCKLPAQGKNL